jgi:hypothetical protein
MSSATHELRMYHVLLHNKQSILAQFMLSLTSQVTVMEINVTLVLNLKLPTTHSRLLFQHVKKILHTLGPNNQATNITLLG